MKALSLTQPWGTLIALGAKTLETRAWQSTHRGYLAIHASATFPRWAQELCYDVPFCMALMDPACPYLLPHYPRDDMDAEMLTWPTLPTGCVVAVVRLVDCLPTERVLPHIAARERAFGDFAPGRWAWRLQLVKRLDPVIPATGARGLWTLDDALLEGVFP